MDHATLGPIVVERAAWLWLVPALPLLGAATNLLLGRRFERAGRKPLVHVVAVGAMALSFLVAAVAFARMLRLPPERRFLEDALWPLFTVAGATVDLAFTLDPLSMMMVLAVTFVGALIHLFSVGYMWHDEADAYWRFFAWLNLFAFSMLLLVMADDLVLMFFGWEGVGLCSYGLISFYYTDRDKAAAGMKAFVVNRVGDFGFLLGLLLLFWSLGGAWAASGRARGPDYVPAPTAAEAAAPRAPDAPPLAAVRVGPTFNLRELRDQVVLEETGVARRLRDGKLFGVSLLPAILILLFVGAMGKSAQLPLYVWLPDAMAGPTPVSALIHAATMVTAGVYLVARLGFLYALSPAAMAWVACVGALTALFATSIAFFQHDIKKVLAYSTVSQLGFMFVGVGVGAFWAGACHLLTHAFFKATLFLAAGSVILGCHHEQDMRRMGGLARRMPVTRWAYLVACWAIAGFPWASGFYSKDEILWKAFCSRHLALFGLPTPWLGPALYAAGVVAATGTSFYMFRSYFMTFTGEHRGGAGEPREASRAIRVVLVVLAAGAVLTGLLGLPAAWTGREPLLESWLAPSLTAAVPFLEEPRALELWFQAAGVGAGAVGFAFAWLLYRGARSTVPARLKARFQGAWRVVHDKYYVDELYDRAVVRPTLALSRLLAWFDAHVIDGLVHVAAGLARGFAGLDNWIDRHLVDGAVNAVAGLTMGTGRALRRIQTGQVQAYVYGALAGGLAVIALNFLLR